MDFFFLYFKTIKRYPHSFYDSKLWRIFKLSALYERSDSRRLGRSLLFLLYQTNILLEYVFIEGLIKKI